MEDNQFLREIIETLGDVDDKLLSIIENKIIELIKNDGYIVVNELRKYASNPTFKKVFGEEITNLCLLANMVYVPFNKALKMEKIMEQSTDMP